MARTLDWPACPNCGGEVTKDYKAYLEGQAQYNKDNPDIPDDSVHGIETAEDPTGGVGICSNCGMAVADPKSPDAALAEPPADAQIPPESPEHMDAPSGTSETPVHAVDPDAPVPAT